MEQATLNCLMSVEIADLPSPPRFTRERTGP